uniref:uncharacterized protein LOC131129730 n=1 Tax=Doryrhamphus excisus TaxID=161450 RepID=UPI0025AE955A|nr:uncharacterized protein LOC131129730 [Doryrhamphus excisus]
MSRNDGLALIRSLNNTQMDIFYKIRQWCLDKVGGRKPEPLHLFITGGAGTGKSHLIKAIQYEATRLLSTMCRQPDNISVCLAAPTGIAAYNLNATTIHSTLSIGKDTRLPYTPLGEETVNSLRAKFADLQILIIDEISIVDHKLLTYIHGGRLRQIKQTGDYAAFVNVSIIAVGDFYQLPPVKGKPLYVKDATFNLWTKLFRVVELTTIVRQKDNQFAALLNRLRKHPKGAALLETDIELLKQRETGEVSSALHVFPTNQQVNEYNLKSAFQDLYTIIKAQDYSQNKKSGKLERKVGHHSKVYNTCLEETLDIAKDARVMLCKHIDIEDGLVNRVCGTVSDILFQQDDTFHSRIYVKFDDAQVGKQRHAQTTNESVTLKDSTFILPKEEKVTKSGGMRHQFPLKLAWACTVHKVQGVTVSNAVVCLDRVFSAGQAYVALSRVTGLTGLIIQDFDAAKIYCNNAIKDAVGRMSPFLSKNVPPQHVQPQFTIYLMNVQNLTKHASDLAACTQHLQPNCIAVTETWLPTACTPSSVTIPGYHFHSQPRCLSYSSSNPALVELQGQQHGGVGMYIADHLHCSVVSAPNFNLEVLLVNCSAPSVLIAVVYRPPSYPMALFQGHLGTLLDWLHQKYTSVVVLGDFNENLLKSSTISTWLGKGSASQSNIQPQKRVH